MEGGSKVIALFAKQYHNNKTLGTGKCAAKHFAVVYPPPRDGHKRWAKEEKSIATTRTNDDDQREFITTFLHKFKINFHN